MKKKEVRNSTIFCNAIALRIEGSYSNLIERALFWWDPLEVEWNLIRFITHILSGAKYESKSHRKRPVHSSLEKSFLFSLVS